MYTFSLLLAGLGVFLFGCKMLSDNMEKIANKGLKNMFFKTQDKKIVGVAIGTVSTAIVQSSSITTVMVVGLVNSGIMSLFQATTIILGANIGTTITGQIAALQTFDFAKIAMGFTGIGFLMTILFSKDKVKTIGYILAGLGLIFVGLSLMSQSMSALKTSPEIINFLSEVNNPFILFLIGLVLTAILQSSSAMTSIIISMAAAGVMIGKTSTDVLYVLMGTNVGTTSTAILSSIGADVNAKRAGIIHLMIKLFGVSLFSIVLIFWPTFMADTFEKLFPGNTATQIAMFHTVFNVCLAIVCTPLTKYIVKLSQLIIKDKKGNEHVSCLDKRLLNTPAIAIEATTKEVIYMLDRSIEAINVSLDGFIALDSSVIEKVRKINKQLEELDKQITNYCIELSSTNTDYLIEKRISSIHDNLSDITRIGELADNVTKYIDKSIRDELVFSDIVKSQLVEMKQLLNSQYKAVVEVLKNSSSDLSIVDNYEDKVDEMRKTLVRGHVERLKNGICNPESSTVFLNLSNNLERVGDHLCFVAHGCE